MSASLFAVNKGYMDDVDVKKVLPFEHGLHAYLKDKHAALLAKAEDSQGSGQGRRGRTDPGCAEFKKSFA
jgi:F-type H+-transporting ATPase subunit alpha